MKDEKARSAIECLYSEMAALHGVLVKAGVLTHKQIEDANDAVDRVVDAKPDTWKELFT